MLNFQEQFQKDLDNVFFNIPVREFVTTHRIAGVRGGKASPEMELDVVVDHELYFERGSKTINAVEGVTFNGLVFFVKKAVWETNFKIVPKVGSELFFDGDRYFVESLVDSVGVLEITLAGHRG